MAGINPNLGNNFKLQNLQLNSTVKVDTQKAEDKDVGDAKPAAVWLPCQSSDFIQGKADVRLGDVQYNSRSNEWRRLTLNEKGEQVWILIQQNDVSMDDFEADRGDLRRP